MFKEIRYILLSGIVLLSAFRVSAQMAMPDRVCAGVTKHYNVTPVAGSTYTWKVNGTVQPGSTKNSIDITWNTPGNFVLEVQEQSAAGCFGTPSRGDVVVNTSPFLAAVGSGPVSCGAPGSIGFNFVRVPDGTYSITHAAGRFDGVLVSGGKANIVAPTGTYTNLAITVAGCSSAPVTIKIIEPLPLKALAAVTKVPCFGETQGSAAVTGSGGTPPYKFLWNNPQQTNTAAASGLNAGGSYTALVKDALGCTANSSVTIPVAADELLVTAVVDQHASCDITNDGRATASATGGNGIASSYSYLWNDPMAQASPTATGLSKGTYMVSVTDGNGCQDTTSLLMPSCELMIWMPNAYSPKGGYERFMPKLNLTNLTNNGNTDDISFNFRMIIFNKWGEEIFETTDIHKGWDGTFNGKPCPPDMYVWIITFDAPDTYSFNQKSPLKGTVMLLN